MSRISRAPVAPSAAAARLAAKLRQDPGAYLQSVMDSAGRVSNTLQKTLLIDPTRREALAPVQRKLTSVVITARAVLDAIQLGAITRAEQTRLIDALARSVGELTFAPSRLAPSTRRGPKVSVDDPVQVQLWALSRDLGS